MELGERKLENSSVIKFLDSSISGKFRMHNLVLF